jgi:hypothetical protein
MASKAARRTAQFSALLAVAAGLTLAPMASAGASATATPATGIKLPVSSAGAMIVVNGQLWVSDPSSSRVDVFSRSGALLHHVIDVPGARGLVASPDGLTVEVAESSASAIAEISTSTYAQTGSITTDGCPSSLAWVNGLLAYSFGCDPGQDTSGVATVDGTNAPVEMLSQMYSPAQLAGSGTTLAVSRLGLDPGEVKTYTVDDTGAATVLATIAPEEGANVTFSPSGTSLLTTAYSDSGAVAFSPTTGNQQIAYPGTGSATAVAASPDGNYLATGFSSYDATINLVNENTDSVVWSRLLTTPPNSGTTYAQLLANTLTFSADSSEVFGLASFMGLSGVYLFASDLHPAASHVSLKVSRTSAGHALPVTVVGPAGARVILSAQTESSTSHSVGSVTLPASGRATVHFKSTFSGTLTARIDGSASRLPTSAHVAYTVGSRSRATILGGHRHHGVIYYRNLKQVRVLLTTTPASDPAYAGTVQVKIHGHWISEPTLRTNEVNGRGGIYFKSMHINLKYRIKFTVSASSASRGSHAMSGVFELR